MEITIRQVLGIEQANLSATPILLLTGVNGAGKSSFLAAVAAALTGEIMIGGTLKKDAKTLVRDGFDSGAVIVRTEEGTAKASWPAAERMTEGRAPTATPIAAGLRSLLGLGDKERSQVLDALLKPSPSQAELAAALRDTDTNFILGGGAATAEEAEAMKPLGLDPVHQREAAIYRIVKKLWAEIEVNGFDGAHLAVKENVANFKGQWQQITGEKYGSEKARNWKHADSHLIDELVAGKADPVGTLTEQVASFKTLVEKTIRNATLTAAKADGNQAKVSRLAELLKAEEVAKAAMVAAREEHGRWQTQTHIPRIPAAPMSCPHCAGAVSVDGDKLVQVSNPPTPDEIAAAKKARAAYDKGLADARKVFDDAYDAHKAAEAAVREAKTAGDRMGDQVDVPVATEEDVAKAKETLAIRERALTAAIKNSDAAAMHRRLIVYQSVVDTLAPEGLRKTKLQKVLDLFNESRLRPLCDAARWPLVTIGPDLQIRFQGRFAREPFISESQVLRTRIILQLACAQIDGSDAVLIDRADKLDPAGRNGLFGLLASTGMTAIVAMTYPRPQLVPDIGANGIGSAAWISKGVAQPLAEAVEEANSAAKPRQAAE